MTMRYNTLQFVNKVLNALDLQPVSTLGETEDAEQVLSIVDRAITELELDLNWWPNRTIVAPSTASGTDTDWRNDYPDIPWAMKLPTGVEAVYDVYYNGVRVSPLDPKDMFRRVELETAFKTTGDPKYWCLGFKDEEYLVFDNFDSDTENQLTKANCDIYVTKYAQVGVSNSTDEIGLTEKFFGTLIHRCISYGAAEINNNMGMHDRYEKNYNIAKSKLLENNRRFKPHKFSLGDYNFSRKRGTGVYISKDQYTDVTS